MSLENYGKYQLVKRLAMGGMAQIYLARRLAPEASQELVVVKRILPHLGENKEFVQMFLDEAKIAARLAHPNIVAIYDLGAQDDSFFIAMEYIHGEDVRRIFKRAAAMELELPVPLAVRIVIGVCAGLDYAHKKTDPSGKPLNIVHRDISPQNILVSFQGGVKVVDFGIAKAADQATVTRSGVLKGKYSYMSPEQASGKRVDCRSDVFALGVVLYEVLTGTRLFKRSTDMATLSAVAECSVTPPSQVNPRVPADLDPIVMKALAKEPDARYSEALQLQVALEAWLSARKLASTTADLAAFMREVYAERLAQEERSGSILVEDDPPLTGKLTAVGAAGRRRSGAVPSVSSKDVTRADRGEQLPAGAGEEVIEPTDLSPPRSGRQPKGAEARREPEAERTRSQRQSPISRHTPVPRRPEFEPRGASRGESEAQSITGSITGSSTGSTTDTTQAPRRRRMLRRLFTGLAATLTLAAAAALGWVALRPPPAPLPPPPLATVRLETVPPGARVMFEGKLLEGVTPLTLPAVAAGSYQVAISLDGYEELRAAVAIPATGLVTLEGLNLIPKAPPTAQTSPKPQDPPPPAPALVMLTLETQPAQATIFVNGEERGPSPQVVEAKAEQELEVKVSAPHYRALSRKVKLGAGPTQVERLTLEPLPKPTPTQPKPPPEPPKAMVRFAVTPWATVSCGGRELGTTPFPEVALSVGVHQCKFHNSDYGRTITQRVEVKATGLNKVVVKFDP
ncbi:MAG: serine/threonine protein kinase [Myxococcaceae bacterium]|nr:serine/threonine protein kinase [Myxococcaceae bacterium]